jgi:hypothetical protein
MPRCISSISVAGWPRPRLWRRQQRREAAFRSGLQGSKRVMKAFDWHLRKKGYIPIGGQIVDASLMPAPKQRNTEGEKAWIKAGNSANEIWPDESKEFEKKSLQKLKTAFKAFIADKVGGAANVVLHVRHRQVP